MSPDPVEPQPLPPPTIRAQWCGKNSQGVSAAVSITWAQHEDETTEAFVERAISELEAELDDKKPSNDCVPSFP